MTITNKKLESLESKFDMMQNLAPARAKSSKQAGLIKIIVVLGLVGIAVAIVQNSGAFLHWNQSKSSAIAPSPVLTVAVQAAQLRQVDHEITVNGSISAWEPVTAGAEISGLQIKSILVDDGASVKKGQIVAVLNSSLIEPQLESEEARLKVSLATARKAMQPNRQEDINGLRAAVSQAKANVAEQRSALAQAQANLLNANQNITRYFNLQKQGAVSLQELETRQTNATVADATVHGAKQKVSAALFALKQAEEKLSMALTGGRAEDIQIANANIEEIRGNIKKYQAQIAQTIIRSPVDGIIIRRDAHIGDISSAGKTMFTIARDNRMELRAQVPESDLSFVKPGEIVDINTALTGNSNLTGRVREISPQIDSETRLATVRIDIPSSKAVKSGMYAEGHIKVGKTAALTIPAQAVITLNDKSFVFVLHKKNNVQQVENRTVVVGSRSGDLVEIKSGISPFDSIVVTGAGFLKDGDYVSLAR